MLAILIPIGYIISIGFWAKPIVSNATLRTAESGGEG
jgi:hypothetical protein